MICFVLIAPPLSGKTWFAQALVERYGFVRISYDEEAVSCGLMQLTEAGVCYESSSEGKWLDFFKLWVPSLCKKHMKTSAPLVLDHHHTLQRQRIEIEALCQKYAYKLIYLVFDLPLDLRLARNRQRSGSSDPNGIPIDEGVLRNWRKFEPIDPRFGQIVEVNHALSYDDVDQIYRSVWSGGATPKKL